MAKLLEVSILSRSFGGITAVDHVSFDLDAGQIIAMIGPNGAGKSTCFNLINGQLQPDHGSIKICGREVAGLHPRQVWKLGVGRTFQIASIFATMTVLENVQMALISFNKQARSFLRTVRQLYVDESMELLRLVGIEDQSHRVCGLLSYGDLKRVELAMALTNQPKLLLLDEPTAGMEPSERRRLMELTTQIVRNQNLGALFTEHDMDVVFTHADRIIVLNRGELIAQGTPEQVRHNDRVKEIYLGSRS
ncbi:MAG: ABC transporter ATP-binding protein [Desulfobacterales bacterium]|nr:MAG: ABC transporter ATP-binding protein [Desulfobacterales bacterium]